ncbi:uncharacterized protein CBL_12160 [Carabus blaptoides fortunei]
MFTCRFDNNIKGTASLGSPSKDSLSAATSSSTGAGAEESLSRDMSQLSLFSTGSGTSQDECFRCPGHAEQSLLCMRSYLQAGQLCDVVLIAGSNGRRVPAHRLVLSAASEYFSAMFTGALREAGESEITLGDVDGDALYALVQYCYTGTIELREDNVETLLATACLMQLGAVTQACCSFLAHQLHPSNCLGIAVFADQQGCVNLLTEATAYTSQHFMQVTRNQEFLQLTSEQLSNLLVSDDLNVPSEQHIFHALMSWIRFEASRDKYIARLLALVKLPLLEPAFIADFVEPVCGDDRRCQELLMEAMKWHLLPERRPQLISARTRPRKSTLGRLLVVGGIDANKGATTIEYYCPRSDKWMLHTNMGGRRLQFSVAMMGDKLLVVGGRDGLKTLNTVECLDLTSGTWSQLPPMNTHRHGLGVAVLSGPLYAVGGHDGWSYLNTVERWDPVTRSWSLVAPMQSQRCTAGVAVLNGRLYAVGGRDGASCLRTVECYDPHTNKWTPCAPMTRRRGGVGVGVANGFLYALGGQDAPANNPAASRFDCVERYDPGTDTWTIVASLSNKRDAVGVCSLGDRLMAIGGYDGGQYLRTVEQYDPNSNEWTSVAPLITGRAAACVVAVSLQQCTFQN